MGRPAQPGCPQIHGVSVAAGTGPAVSIHRDGGGCAMAGLEVEGLFTAALGLQAPWSVQKVDLNAANSSERSK